MDETIRHLEVPIGERDRSACLGPDGSAALIGQVIRMIEGRWKLPVLFRLLEKPSVRTLELKRDLVGISQKVLTQQLRALELDQLVDQHDFNEKPRHVEYSLSALGVELMPVLRSLRRFADIHPGTR